MVVSRQIGMAMAAQVSRVNGGGSGKPLPDVYEQLRQAQQEIDRLRAQVESLQTRQPAGITLGGETLTTPAEFARAHRVSVSTVNRALNSDELKGVRQPNNRWLVVADQPYQPKRHRS